jgi:hypothetical protein
MAILSQLGQVEDRFARALAEGSVLELGGEFEHRPWSAAPEAVLTISRADVGRVTVT